MALHLVESSEVGALELLSLGVGEGLMQGVVLEQWVDPVPHLASQLSGLDL